MRTASEIDRMYEERARKAEQAVTPGHAAAEAAVSAGEEDEAARRRRARVQHEVDPVPPEVPGVARVDVEKLYRDALDAPANPAYPAMRPVSAETFRSGPGPGARYEGPGWSVPVPSAVLAPGMVTRPLLTDGQSRPSAPGAC